MSWWLVVGIVLMGAGAAVLITLLMDWRLRPPRLPPDEPGDDS